MARMSENLDPRWLEFCRKYEQMSEPDRIASYNALTPEQQSAMFAAWEIYTTERHPPRSGSTKRNLGCALALLAAILIVVLASMQVPPEAPAPKQRAPLGHQAGSAPAAAVTEPSPISTPTPRPTTAAARPALDVQALDAENTQDLWGNVESQLQHHCENEWPNDYNMQRFCINQQRQAVDALKMRNPYSTGVPVQVLWGIRTKCRHDWTNDYNMRDFCEKQQFGAYHEIHGDH